MKLTLLTYDSMLVYNAGYAHSCKAVDFSKTLMQLVSDFSKNTGVEKDIYWEEVTDSDWCKGMILIYAKVDKDWKPTKDTNVISDTYDPNWYPNLEVNLSSWIYGRGRFVDIQKDPAKNPHSLYRTSIR